VDLGGKARDVCGYSGNVQEWQCSLECPARIPAIVATVWEMHAGRSTADAFVRNVRDYLAGSNSSAFLSCPVPNRCAKHPVPATGDWRPALAAGCLTRFTYYCMTAVR
jgi:hypothetical protein